MKIPKQSSVWLLECLVVLELTRCVAYNQKASLDTVLSIYKDFDPRATRLFELADPEGFRVWKLVDMDEIPTWSRNSTVLLGDAW